MNQKTEFLNKRKRDAINRMLEGEFALVHINPDCAGVELPAHLKGSKSVTLKLSRLFRGALDVGELIISAELLFGSEYFTCCLPYDAIWGATSSESKNSVWPESAPEAVLNEVMKAGRKEPEAATDSPPPRPHARPQLKRIK